MLPLGTQAPDFSLEDPSGRVWTLSDVRVDSDGGASGPFVVMFVCNHCPFVKHVGPALGELASDLSARGVPIVAIMSNDVENYPADAPDLMAATAGEWGWDFPYLHDETQEVAKAYRAACTPDFFVFNGDAELVYRGQMDDSRPANGVPVAGSDLMRAVESALAGVAVPEPHKPSMGCNIKWRPGSEPPWFG